MKLNAKFKKIQLDGSHELDAFERFVVGYLDSDGLIVPHNEPVLVYKKTTHVIQTTGTGITVLTLPTDLKVSAGDLKNYKIETYVQFSNTGDGAVGDDVAISVTDGTVNQYTQITDVGGYPATRDLDPGSRGVITFPMSSSTALVIDALDWAATETHDFVVTVMAWRFPADICTE